MRNVLFKVVMIHGNFGKKLIINRLLYDLLHILKSIFSYDSNALLIISIFILYEKISMIFHFINFTNFHLFKAN
jgi:hypothetical protein